MIMLIGEAKSIFTANESFDHRTIHITGDLNFSAKSIRRRICLVMAYARNLNLFLNQFEPNLTDNTLITSQT